MAVVVQIRERINFHRDINSTLIKGLLWQRNAGEFCDVSVKINGRRFCAHKAVLAATSPYFRSMFTSHMKEELSHEVDLSASLQLESDDTFREILDFMYCGDIDITSDNAEDMLRAADFLLLEDVKEYCREFYLQHGNLNLSNCLCVYILAEQHNLKDVAEVARAMVESRFHDHLLYSEEFLEFPESVLLTVLSDKGITRFSSDDAIVKNVMRWVKHDEYSRQSTVVNFLSHVRISRLGNDSIKLLLHEPSVRADPELVLKLTQSQRSCVLDEEGACSIPLMLSPVLHDVDNKQSFTYSVTSDHRHREPVILGLSCNAMLKYLKVLCYRVQEDQWYYLSLKNDIVKSVPSRFGICSGIQSGSILYLYLNYTLPYPSDMLRIHMLAVDVDSGDHVQLNFRHRYNSTECCQTTLTDNKTVPPAVAFCNGCLCVIGNVEGSGHVYVCDLGSLTYMCYQIPKTRFISLARVATKNSRYLYIWCRHRFGHEEYCINKEVSFIMFDVRNKTFSHLDVPAPPGVSYEDFAEPHVLCVESDQVIVHSPGKGSLVLDEVHGQWLTHCHKLPCLPPAFSTLNMPYHGFNLYAYCSRDLYVLQNPLPYTTGLTRLVEAKGDASPCMPPPLDGLSLAVAGHMLSRTFRSLESCPRFDESYTRITRSRCGYLAECDTEESDGINSDIDADYECDGYEYDEEIYDYYADFS